MNPMRLHFFSLFYLVHVLKHSQDCLFSYGVVLSIKENVVMMIDESHGCCYLLLRGT